MNDSSWVFEIIYNTMQQSHNTLSVKTLCEMAGVSRSGYYAWVKAAPARALKEQQDHDDFDLILAAYKMHGYTKGAKGMSWMPLPSRYCCMCSAYRWKWISFWKPSTNWWKIMESPSRRKRSFIQIRAATIPATSS